MFGHLRVCDSNQRVYLSYAPIREIELSLFQSLVHMNPSACDYGSHTGTNSVEFERNFTLGREFHSILCD